MKYGQTNEFYDRSLEKFLEEKNIEICHTETVDKLVFDETFIETKRNRIYRYMISASKNLYIEKLEDMVKQYNNTYRCIKVCQKYKTIKHILSLLSIIVNLQNICDMIVPNEFNVGRIVFSVPILHSLIKRQKHSNSVAGKNINLLMKNESIIHY